jgi:hypothetical protein
MDIKYELLIISTLIAATLIAAPTLEGTDLTTISRFVASLLT